ncbi:MAG: hypothetical protein HQM10_25625 [Candidatus Riflebacteria bacterium]|nr:hypothetical protein [Candidatus Riflebacteria bacterium]
MMYKVTLRIPESDHEMLKAFAEINGKSMSSVVSELIRKFASNIDIHEYLADQEDGMKVSLLVDDGKNFIDAEKVFNDADKI